MTAVLLLTTLQAGAVTLVEKQSAKAVIVVPQPAAPMTRKAADELAAYMQKISGAKLTVIEGEPSTMPEHAIWVGVQPAVKRLFPGVDVEFKQPEEIVIAATADHLLIAGRDVWDPQRLRMPGRHKNIAEDWQDEYGTANAVSTFLQEQLGVRWLWPGESGEDVPRRETITIEPMTFRYHPQIRLRSGIFFASAPGDGRGISQEWVRRQRVSTDSCNQRHRLMWLTGAAFEDWWQRFHETHPEYFALQPNGSRTYYKELGPDKVKVCHSDPAVQEQWLADVEAQLRENPTQSEFNASPNDGYRTGHCVCARCLAWDPPTGEPQKYVWPGIVKDGVPLSDRHVTFANIVAAELNRRHPEREMFVHMQSYGNWRTPPVKTRPDDRVIVQCVTNFLVNSGPAREEAIKEHEGWAKVSKQIVWRPNMTGRWWQGLPETPLHQIIDDFKFAARSKGVGIFVASTWENWATQGPAYYVMAQLAWNAEQDGQKLLDDYYQRGFGPAASEVKAYWAMMEQAYHRRADENRKEAEVYSAALFQEAGACLDRAQSAVAGDRPVLRERVALVRAGLEYTRLLTEIRLLVESKATDAATIAKLNEDWKGIEAIVNANRATINRQYFRREGLPMRRLNPDYLERK